MLTGNVLIRAMENSSLKPVGKIVHTLSHSKIRIMFKKHYPPPTPAPPSPTPCLWPVLFICSSLGCFNSSIMLVFAQVLGGELESTRLWRAAHSIYCPDPISEGQWRGWRLALSVDGWVVRGWWKKSWLKCRWGSSGHTCGGGGNVQAAGAHGRLSAAPRPRGLLLLTASPPDLFICLAFLQLCWGQIARWPCMRKEKIYMGMSQANVITSSMGLFQI